MPHGMYGRRSARDTSRRLTPAEQATNMFSLMYWWLVSIEERRIKQLARGATDCPINGHEAVVALQSNREDPQFVTCTIPGARIDEATRQKYILNRLRTCGFVVGDVTTHGCGCARFTVHPRR